MLLGGLRLLAVVIFLAIRAAEHSRRISADLLRLQDTTAQIRVRAAFVLLLGFVALAEQLGLEVDPRRLRRRRDPDAASTATRR